MSPWNTLIDKRKQLDLASNVKMENITDVQCHKYEPSDISEHGDLVWTVNPNNYTCLVCIYGFRSEESYQELFPNASFFLQ